MADSELLLHKLPVFPLSGVVLFPTAVLPLHIFEPRYRQMLTDVIAEGGRRFGMLNVNGKQETAEIGCIAEIIEVEPMSDGRSNIITVGAERFRVVRSMNDKDYQEAFISLLFDAPSNTNLKGKMTRTVELITAVYELIEKVHNVKIAVPLKFPDDPEELSFWVASALPASATLKQMLLELTDTRLRLKHEITLLDALAKQLAARSAIESAFKKS